MQLSLCIACGRPIYWPGSDASDQRPQSYLRVTKTYTPHRCRTADKMAYARRHPVAETPAVIRAFDPDKPYTKTERTAAWTEALPRPCPRCGVRPDNYCINLNSGKTIQMPHLDRLR